MLCREKHGREATADTYRAQGILRTSRWDRALGLRTHWEDALEPSWKGSLARINFHEKPWQNWAEQSKVTQLQKKMTA